MPKIKKNADEAFERLGELFSGGGTDRIYAGMGTRGYHQVKKCENPDAYGENRFLELDDGDYAALLERHAAGEKDEIDDDSFPYYYPNEFDEAIYGALVGAKAVFSVDEHRVSSMVFPFVKDLDEVRHFVMDEGHPWFKAYKKRLEMGAKNLKGKIGINDVIDITGLNYLVEILGATEAYLALFDVPEKAKYAMDFSTAQNIWLREMFFDVVGLQDGGSFVFGHWFPGKVVNESVDAFHLASAETFERWGRGPLEKMFSHFDGGALHLHGNGRHLLESVSEVKGLKFITMGDDRPFPPAHEVVEELAARSKNVPIEVFIPYEAFAKRLAEKTLPGNVFYTVWSVPDSDTGNRLMGKVKSYRI